MFKAELVPYNETYPITNNSTERALHNKLDNFRFDHLGYYKLLDYGTYYYPAWKHYKRKTTVFCDRCHRQNMQASIGYAQYDLCLLCVDELTNMGYDCPSRQCHESKFINDNSVDYTRPEYVNQNRIWWHQNYDMNPDKNIGGIEGFVDVEKSHGKCCDSKQNNQQFNIVVTQGTYHYPAWKHYGKKTTVICNRCGKQNLKASIGYGNTDLCLICVDKLTRLGFDCPSRHCYQDAFINDNSNSLLRSTYIDLNSGKHNKHLKNINKKLKKNIEGFCDFYNKSNIFKQNSKFIITVIIGVIMAALIMNYNQ